MLDTLREAKKEWLALRREVTGGNRDWAVDAHYERLNCLLAEMSGDEYQGYLEFVSLIQGYK